MKRALTLLGCGAAFGAHLLAQLDLLTYREAEAVVEQVPDVAAARDKGRCPRLSGAYDGQADEVSFWVRDGCGSGRGQLIGVYKVDRRTARITVWGDNPVAVDGPDLQRFGSRLILQVRNRLLSAAEASCLAAVAAQGVDNWISECSSVSIEAQGNAGHSRMRFTVLCRSSLHPTETGRMLSVDLWTAQVRDDQTGQYLMSERLGSITSKILALRDPLWLTEKDALLIALRIPSVVAGLHAGCRLYTAGPFRSEEIEIGEGCSGKQAVGTTGLVVNLKTGETTADTGKPLESPESGQLARQLLGAKERNRTALREEVGAACASEPHLEHPARDE